MRWLAAIVVLLLAAPAIAQNGQAPAAGPASAPTPAAAPTTAPTAAPAPSAAPGQRAITDLPIASGLPLIVRSGLAVIALEGVDENEETFTGTVDLRLSWIDTRLRYPAGETPIGYREWRGDGVAAQLTQMWSPRVQLANMRGDATRQSQGLRLYPDGRVELIRRVTGTFAAPLDVRRFPFDRQDLPVDLVSQGETADKVQLDFRQDDLSFSRPSPDLEVPGWTVGAISLDRVPLPGWYGESYSRLRASLEVSRSALATVPSLFVPLLASLLIPLLATWLNRSRDGEFEIEAFELTNIIIGGLFAVIALNFTVNSERSILASGANTVSLLFGLNYLALAAALVINVALYRFNVVRAISGRHVQHEAARFITWAFPLAVAASAIALILIAAA